MEGNYVLNFGKDPVGKVQVLRQGLYYRFICRCKLTGEVVYRLKVRCGDATENPGILVRTGDGFGLDKKVPVSHLGDGEMIFLLMPKSDRLGGRFIPIRPEEPFAYIMRLQDAFFTRRDGQAGVMLKEKGDGISVP